MCVLFRGWKLSLLTRGRTWIVPEYTTAPSEACTGFIISVTGGTQPGADNLAVHDGRRCFLEPLKNKALKNKITQVALVRGEGTLSGSPILAHYQGLTGNIKQGWTADDDLHLAWKTVEVSI